MKIMIDTEKINQLSVKFTRLTEGGWMFEIAPVDEQNRGGCGSDPELRGAITKAARMLTHVAGLPKVSGRGQS